MQRKSVFYLVAALALLVVLLSAALVVSAEKGEPPGALPNSLSISGGALPPAGPIRVSPPQNPEALVNDGSFENGPPPASAWTEVTNVSCEWIGDWSAAWGVPAHDGSIDFWAGGYCDGTPATSSVSQAGIAVPATDNDLHFWYNAYRPDPDDGDNDRAYVKVNGTEVWTLPLTQASNTFPNWVEVVLPMAAYASQNVTLEFGGISEGASTGNIRYDYISFGTPPPPAPRCPVGSTEVTVLTQDFEGAFPPAGWAVANNGGNCVWTNTDPGGRGNLTGGTGAFAIADSDDCGLGTTMDTELWTPAIDLTGLIDPMVAFNLDYDALGDYAAVDASTNNGTTWGNLITWTASQSGPRLYETAIPGAGENDVRVRWHYGNANYAWWWEVDSVEVTACQPNNPAIELNKTVGTTPGVCAAGDTVTVTAGTQVYYCYQATNTGTVAFNFHDLVDSELGTILDNFPYALAPGASSPQVIVPDTPMATVTNVGTWTAVSALAGYSADDTIPYNWQDISGTGTAVTLTDDSVSAALPMGFSFDFFGTGYTDAYASSNGFMTFASGSSNGCCSGQALPNPLAPNNLVAGWWEDLNPSAGGTVHYQTLGSAPNRVFILQFTNIQHLGGGNAVTMQWKLFETTNVIEVHYQAAPSDGGTHSAGIENVDGTVGVQWSYGTAALTTPEAVQYAPTPVATATDTDTATVTVLTPNIDVAPLSLSSTQPANTSTTLPMTVANTGQGNLTWQIAEEPVAQPPAPLSGGDALVAADTFDGKSIEQPAGAAPELSDWRAPEAMLYDNGPLVTNPGAGAGGANASALQTALGLGTYGVGNQVSAGNRVADDFTVGGSGWLISTVTFFGYQTGSTTTSTFTAVNLRIWDGPPNVGTSMVVFGDTTTNRLVSSTWSNMYRVLDTALTNTDRPVMANVVAINTFLPAGTYWLDWQADGTLGSGPWAPPVSILGQTGKPGANGLQYTSTGWDPVVDVAPQDFPFIVEGLADCSNLVDVPWLSTSPITGTNTGGTNTPVNVTLDASGLADGLYTARLCVTSNDPDFGPGNGTNLVIVPVTLTVQGTPAITVAKTVGTVPGVCAVTSSIDVAPGTTVYYCYTVTNTGDVTLNSHTLVDDQLGTIFTNFAYALTPGSSVNTVAAGLSIPAVINTTTTNVATWTAAQSSTGGLTATATATATVNVASIEIAKTVGTVPGVCAATSSITVASGTTVYYCYTVTNTGDATLNLHTLVDSRLGTIFTGFAYALTPGSSVNTVAAGLSIPAVITVPTTNTATWTAYNQGGPSVTATATAFVDVYLWCNDEGENFDAAVPPAGWSVVSNLPNGPQWTTIAGCGELGNYATGNGGAACASGLNYPDGNFDTELRTPPFSLVGWTGGDLNFQLNFQSWAGIDRLTVDISPNGGTTWTTIRTYSTDQGVLQGLPGVNVNLDLTPWAGQANLKLRWRYYSTASSPGWYAQVDEVKLKCSAPPPTAVSLASLSAATNSPLPVPAGLPVAALPAVASLALGAAYVLRRRR